MKLISALIGYIITAAIFAGAWTVWRGMECDAQWKESGIQNRYKFIGGCQVKHAGVWWPDSNVRVFIDTKSMRE